MEKRTYGAADVAGQLGVSRGYAYKVIRALNAELEAAGHLTVPGKVAASYFEERYFGTGGVAGREGSHVG